MVLEIVGYPAATIQTSTVAEQEPPLSPPMMVAEVIVPAGKEMAAGLAPVGMAKPGVTPKPHSMGVGVLLPPPPPPEVTLLSPGPSCCAKAGDANANNTKKNPRFLFIGLPCMQNDGK